ncbi:metallophosphoesterase family protein [Poriferisphaera sp. WC338]|uniref:metallophosphoesterase family protein n=1 Tax=Poriferisphaera sp. WC338 TaxID=3425129 RepID=UPI003D8160A6
MQRILYLTDTHLGASNTDGYFMQPRCLKHWRALLSTLKQFLQENSVDLILHGGDLIDTALSDTINRAADDMRSLGVPVQLCLGNHDLDHLEAINNWLKFAPDLFPQKHHTGAIRGKHAHIFILAHHYGSTNPPHHWNLTFENAQIPVIDPTQRASLELFLAASDKPVILATHCPVTDVPPHQLPGPNPFHPPDPQYASYLLSLADQSAKLPLILTAHNHVNACVPFPRTTALSTAAFTEAPCSARLITIDAQTITIERISFAQKIDLNIQLDPDNAWVCGLPAYEKIVLPLQPPPQADPSQIPAGFPI